MIPVLNVNESAREMHSAMDAAGCLVIKNVSSEQDRSSVIEELDSYIESTAIETDVDPEEFYPGHTKRITALIARSETCRSLVMHPTLHSIVGNVLQPNCERYQLHVATALVVGPGARKQVLHREEDIYPFFEVPRPSMVVASMWAMTDFTKENGATQIVPGSHKWQKDRDAEPDEVLQAEMSAGDLLIWHGGILHGAGANVANDWRYGVFLSFSLGWLRQEENQYLDVPRHIAETLPKELRDLVGYKMHDGLGFYDPSVQ